MARSAVARWWTRRTSATAAGHDLGDGVWRSAADRLARALRSYEQMAGAVPEGAGRAELEAAFAQLATAVADGRAACAAAQAVAPSSGLDVPAGPDGAHTDLHHRITRLGAEIAAAAEGAAMVRAGDASALARVGTRAGRARTEAADVRARAERPA